jgi:methionine aminopeptidase
LLGANTVQVCTGVMMHGYEVIKELCRGLEAFMDRHGFKTIDDFRGHSLQYFTTHADLVERQSRAKAMDKAAAKGAVTKDSQWTGDKFVQQSDGLVAN